jgi:RNA polymerase sigma-70 factor (ECF subfamily)
MALDESSLDGIYSAPATSAQSGGTSSNPYEEMDEEVARAMKDLPEEYLTALLLWAIEDFSYKEIATALDVPIGTVMSRLHRARTKLSERLASFVRKERIIRE